MGRDTLHYGHTSVQIHEGGAKEEFQNGLRSFLREARTMSRFLNMRGIVSVRDFFQENDTAYIVMEYIDGVSMKQHIRRHGKMAGDEVLRLMEPVLVALYQMHEAGLIHRDISADNLMLTREGEVRLFARKKI
nr:protein kinase [Eubacterium sp.]